MRLSQTFGRPSKTEGTDLVLDSHRLLIQAGFIRESSAGRYYILPLGLRVHDKIVEVIRTHMNKAGGQELVMPTLHPIGLWQETNRTKTTGFELLKVKDRRGDEFALGGTAEEVAVDLMRKFNISYRDLPINIYQFSMKFRDELRARGGLLRVREFVMKDAYSFGTEEQFKATYKQMEKVYKGIFAELGLKTSFVASDNGYIGGEYSHEFIVDSPVGESRYFVSEDGSYAAHEDIAQFVKYQENSDEPLKPIQEVEGKGIIGVEKLAKHLKIPVEKTTKTILFETEKGLIIAAATMGLYDINETKLKHIVGSAELKLADPNTVERLTGAKVGYAGFINLPKEVKVILDESVKGRKNFEVGANHTNFHTINANFGRDFPAPDKFYDISMAREGDEAPNGKGKLSERRGIEVGNIFQLGYHYTNLMKDAEYTDEQGRRQKYYMGCYGIGIGRTMAAIIEAHHDKKGIIWPKNIAPAAVHLISIGDEAQVTRQADELYDKLTADGIDVLYDDRDMRVGEKFADADLIGIPLRVVVSQNTTAQGAVEIKERASEKSELVKADEITKLAAR